MWVLRSDQISEKSHTHASINDVTSNGHYEFRVVAVIEQISEERQMELFIRYIILLTAYELHIFSLKLAKLLRKTSSNDSLALWFQSYIKTYISLLQSEQILEEWEKELFSGHIITVSQYKTHMLISMWMNNEKAQSCMIHYPHVAVDA